VAKVTVHNFRIWDQGRGAHVSPATKRTAAQIKEMGAELMAGTAEEVDSSDLHADGRYLHKLPKEAG